MNLGWLLPVLGLGLTEASCCLFERISEVLKHQPRPTIHMEKQLGWNHKLGGEASLGIYKAGQTVLARLMESQIWHQLAVSVRGGFRKGTMASAHLDVRHFTFSLYITGAFPAATPALELRGSKSEQVSLCVGSLRGTTWGPAVSSTDPIPAGFYSQ